MAKRVLIIGGVPVAPQPRHARAGSAEERRDHDRRARPEYVSFANCGLPYFLSGDIQKHSKLLLQTPEGFDSRYRVEVLVNTEAVEIDRTARRVFVKGPIGQAWIDYDALILAQGGNPIMPPSRALIPRERLPSLDGSRHGSHQRFRDKADGRASAVISRRRIHRPGNGRGVHEAGHRHDSRRDAPQGHGDDGSRARQHDHRPAFRPRRACPHGTALKAVDAACSEVELSDGSRIPGVVLMSVGVRPD